MNSSSRNQTPRNTTRDAFMKKYICVRESIFRLFREVSLGHLCWNSLIVCAATTSRNLTPAPRYCKTACKRALFFWPRLGGLPYPTWDSPPPCKQAHNDMNNATLSYYEYLWCLSFIFGTREKHKGNSSAKIEKYGRTHVPCYSI